MMKATLGGKRLGAENKLPTVYIDKPKSSKHNLSRANRFSAGIGTLVPVMIEVGEPGDEWDLASYVETKTIPTQGPVFGTLIEQVDMFFVPTRLYNAGMHMNLGPDFKPEDIYLPVMWLNGKSGKAEDSMTYDLWGTELNMAQVHPTSWAHRAGISGFGRAELTGGAQETLKRKVNMIPWLAYWDIYYNYYANKQEGKGWYMKGFTGSGPIPQSVPAEFDLRIVNEIKKMILGWPEEAPFDWDVAQTSPRLAPYVNNPYNEVPYASSARQAGLAIKTHNSDRFNAWLNTDTVERISSVTRVAVDGGSFSIDDLYFGRKMNRMLNKMMVAGGTFNDWLKVIYGQSVRMQTEIPEWIGTIKGKISFQDIYSTAAVGDDPLGTLAARGFGRWQENGEKYRVHEPGYLMAIYSVTPQPTYSQGNKWFWRQNTLADGHMPDLDAIGWQDLITDEMAAFDTVINTATGEVTYHSVGKQPAYTQYMTAVDENHGSFAIPTDAMFMVFDRQYEASDATGIRSLADATTYINPEKYNQIFADGDVNAENIWVQIAFGAEARRLMSKKVMPNL